jgi:hypothetical protein
LSDSSTISDGSSLKSGLSVLYRAKATFDDEGRHVLIGPTIPALLYSSLSRSMADMLEYRRYR